MKRLVTLILVLLFGGALSARPEFSYAYVPTYGPGTVTATAKSTSEIDLNWDSVSADPAVSGYEIQRESPIGGGFTTIVINTGSSATTYNNTGLAAGTVYNYRVAAINSDGVGPFGPTSINANSAYAETFAPVLGPPGPPTGLTAMPTSTSEIDLSWTAPGGGVQILGYKIERESPPGSGFTTVVANTNSANTTYRDMNLYPPGTTYNYRVSGVNVFGAGSPSAVVSAITNAVPAAPPIDAKAIPGNGQVMIAWSPPNFTGGTITGYVVSSTPPGFSTTTTGSATSVVITGLTNNSSYSFTVAAVNAVGTGLPSYTNPVAPTASAPSFQLPVAATTTSPASASPPAYSLPVVSSSKFYFSSNLYKGLRGEAVTALQNYLTAKGFYSGPVTGYFGVLTEASVEAYQRAHYISSTGFVGSLSRAYLNAGL